MTLTTAQNLILKTYILADPVLLAFPNSTDGAYEMLPLLNAIANPDFIVWRTSVDPNEIMKNGMDWTRVDNLSVGKARIWDWLTKLGPFNPTKLNIRAGIDATWVGTTADLAVREQVYIHCKRPANLIEKLFAVGVGSTLSPAVMGFEGLIEYMAVYEARNS